MSARGILTKFVNAKLREQNKSLDGRITEKVFQAFGVKTSRAKVWFWIAKEMGKQNGSPPPVTRKRKRKDQKLKAGTAMILGNPDDFYNSRDWQACRFDALKKSKGCCVLCGRSPREHGVVLHVDHIKPRSKAPHLQLHRDNLQVLCKDCNLGKGNRDDTDWR